MENYILLNIENHLSFITASFSERLLSAMEQYKRLQESGKKGELFYIYISFLRSSILCKKPLFRIDLYDEQGISDICECCISWDLPFITKTIYMQRPVVKEYSL